MGEVVRLMQERCYEFVQVGGTPIYTSLLCNYTVYRLILFGIFHLLLIVRAATSNNQDRDQLARFFEEDAKVVAKREKLTIRRDRLSKASAAMASVSLHSMGARSVRVTLTAGPYGFGLSLADENGRVVVKARKVKHNLSHCTRSDVLLLNTCSLTLVACFGHDALFLPLFYPPPPAAYIVCHSLSRCNVM